MQNTPTSREALTWRLVTAASEYDAVVQLRTRAYSKAGKIDPSRNDSMRDSYDESARILAGWHGEVPVASLRIMIHPAGTRWEHEQFVSLEGPGLPPKEQTAEITRVCVDPDWSGADTSLRLFQNTALEVLRLRRRYILGSATRGAMRIYTRIGCRETDIQFQWAELGGGMHRVFFADLVNGIGGHRIPWKIWSIVWSDVHRQARKEGILPRPGLGHGAKLAAWRAARPLLISRSRRRA